jgi:hypothetical protein
VIEYTTNDPAFPKVEVPVTGERKLWDEIVNGPGGGGAKASH